MQISNNRKRRVNSGQHSSSLEPLEDRVLLSRTPFFFPRFWGREEVRLVYVSRPAEAPKYTLDFTKDPDIHQGQAISVAFTLKLNGAVAAGVNVSQTIVLRGDPTKMIVADGGGNTDANGKITLTLTAGTGAVEDLKLDIGTAQHEVFQFKVKPTAFKVDVKQVNITNANPANVTITSIDKDTKKPIANVKFTVQATAGDSVFTVSPRNDATGNDGTKVLAVTKDANGSGAFVVGVPQNQSLIDLTIIGQSDPVTVSAN